MYSLNMDSWAKQTHILKVICLVVLWPLTLSLLWFGFRSWHWGAHRGGCRSSQHLQAREEGIISVQAQPPVHRGSSAELHQPLTETHEQKHTDKTYFLLERGIALITPTPKTKWKHNCLSSLHININIHLCDHSIVRKTNIFYTLISVKNCQLWGKEHCLLCSPSHPLGLVSLMSELRF